MLLLFVPLLTLGCAMSPPRSLAPEDMDAPRTAAEYEALGDAALVQGDSERALLEYVKALAVDRDNVEVLYKIGTLHRETGRVQVARQAYEQVLDAQPDHAGALEGQGLILLGQGLYDQAAHRLLAALAADSNRWRTLNALGVIADMEGAPDEAEIYYTRALAQRPLSALVLNNFGYSRYLVGDWEGAQRYYLRAVNIEPANLEAWSNLGLLYVRRGLHEEALSAFQAVMKPEQALNAVGYLCLVNGDREAAGIYLKRAIEASSTYYVEAHRNLARLRDTRRRAGGGDG